ENNQFLPSRFSYSQDYWGMYNGKNNTTSVPDYLHEVGQKGIYFPGANKYPDKDFAVIGSLKKIKLPTGGYQVFEYELDQFRTTDFTNDYEYLPVHNFQKMNFQIIAGDSHDFNVDYPILADQDPNVEFSEGYNYNFCVNHENNPSLDLADDEMPSIGTTYYVAKIIKANNELPMNIYGGVFTPPDNFFELGSDYSVVVRKIGNAPIASSATFGVEW